MRVNIKGFFINVPLNNFVKHLPRLNSFNFKKYLEKQIEKIKKASAETEAKTNNKNHLNR